MLDRDAIVDKHIDYTYVQWFVNHVDGVFLGYRQSIGESIRSHLVFLMYVLS